MTADSVHAPVRDLLPWYANGTATPEERALVARHLQDCAECRDELAFLQDVGAGVAEAADAIPPFRSQLDRTMAAIDDWEAARPRTALRGLAAFFDAIRHPPTPALQFALVAQLVVIAGLAAVLIGRHPSPSFTTLSDSQVGTARPRLTVVFQPTATEADIRASLRAAGATVVGGPSAIGVYVIQVPVDGDAAVDAVIDSLRKQTAIYQFVERQP